MGHKEVRDRSIRPDCLTHRDLVARARDELREIIEELQHEKANNNRGESKPDEYDLGNRAVENLGFLHSLVSKSPALAEYFKREAKEAFSGYSAVPIAQTFPSINNNGFLTLGEYYTYTYIPDDPDLGLRVKYHAGTDQTPDLLKKNIREGWSLTQRFARMDQIGLVRAIRAGLQ